MIVLGDDVFGKLNTISQHPAHAGMPAKLSSFASCGAMLTSLRSILRSRASQVGYSDLRCKVYAHFVCGPTGVDYPPDPPFLGSETLKEGLYKAFKALYKPI